VEIKIYTDGGSINNPGPAAIAYLIYLNDKMLHSFSAKIGINTNNFAEYTALVRALEWIRQNNKESVSKITFFSDSNLMVNQLNGFYRVKNASIREFILKVRALEQEIKTAIVYKYIPREKNSAADLLVKKELNKQN